MKITVRLATLGSVALAVTALGAAAASAPASASAGPGSAGSVFVQTDDPSGNAVVARWPRSPCTVTAP
jgi:hypothetical protein